MNFNGNDSRSSMNSTENPGVLDFGFDIDLENPDFLETHEEVVHDLPYLGTEQFHFASKTDLYMGIKKRVAISVDDTESSCSQFSDRERSEFESTTLSAKSIKQRLYKTVIKRCKAEGKVLVQPEKVKVEIMPTKEEVEKEHERKERNKLSAKKSRDNKKAAELELKKFLKGLGKTVEVSPGAKELINDSQNKDNEKLESENKSLKATVEELEEKLSRFVILEKELSQSYYEPRIQQEKNDDSFMVTGLSTEYVINCSPLEDKPDEELCHLLEQIIEATSNTSQVYAQESQSHGPQLLPYTQEETHFIAQDNSSESQLAVSGSAYHSVPSQSAPVYHGVPFQSAPNTLHVKTLGGHNIFEQLTDSEIKATENNGMSSDLEEPRVISEVMAGRVGVLSLGGGSATTSVSPPSTSYAYEANLAQTASNCSPDVRSVKSVLKRPSPWTVADANDEKIQAELKQIFSNNENREPPEKKIRFG